MFVRVTIAIRSKHYTSRKRRSDVTQLEVVTLNENFGVGNLLHLFDQNNKYLHVHYLCISGALEVVTLNENL